MTDVKTIAVDFDGTCVVHKYPEIGNDIGAVSVLKELVHNSHEIILYTMRSGKQLQEAVDWFVRNDIRLYGIQTNPTQQNWTKSPKCYAHMYIDDAALGCPMINPTNGDRPFVDWAAVKTLLIEKSYL